MSMSVIFPAMMNVNLTGGAEAAETTWLGLQLPNKIQSCPLIAFAQFLVNLLQHLPPPAAAVLHRLQSTYYSATPPGKVQCSATKQHNTSSHFPQNSKINPFFFFQKKEFYFIIPIWFPLILATQCGRG